MKSKALEPKARKAQKALTLAAFAAAFFAAPALAAPAKAKAIPEAIAKQAVARYAEVVDENYRSAVSGARALRDKIDAFVKAPTQASLEAARDAWKSARDAYAPTEAFRFYGGPIDDPNTGPEGMINAWPIDEAYLDSVNGSPDAGIINNPKLYPQITLELLTSLNEKDGEKNISTGFHAIEFLLWGQDFSTSGPGRRGFEDFVPGKGRNAERRAKTLSLLAELLENHLSQVAAFWVPGAPNGYAEQLKKEPIAESLRKIYTGLVGLSIDEMAGERMTVALEKNDQENEQDCFSDYTVKDMMSNERGIHAVYFGSVGGKNGVGIHDVVKALDPNLAKATQTRLMSAKKSLEAMKKTFDQTIASKPGSPERKLAQRAIHELEEQARIIAKSGLAMGLPLNIQ